MPVSSGHRLTLTYNLYPESGGRGVSDFPSATLDVHSLPMYTIFKNALESEVRYVDGRCLGECLLECPVITDVSYVQVNECDKSDTVASESALTNWHAIAVTI